MSLPPPFHTPSVPTNSRKVVHSIPNHMNGFEHAGNSVTNYESYYEQQIQKETFNWHEIDADASRRMTDNPQYRPQVRSSNNTSDANSLIATCSAQYDRLLQSGMADDPVTKYIFDISNSVPLSTIHNQNPVLFNATIDDINANNIINGYQQYDSPIENLDQLSEWLDRCQADEQSTDVQTFEPCMQNQMSSPCDRQQQQLQFYNSNQNNTFNVSSATNFGTQQSSSYGCIGLQFQSIPSPQPVPSPTCYFGYTEVTYCDPDIHVQPTNDFDSLTNEKSSKNSTTNASSSPPPDPPRQPHLFDPYIYENGKRRRMLLHEYLRRLLDNPNCSHIAQYVDKRRGIFKFFEKEQAAELWETVKGRNSNTSKCHFLYYYLQMT